jgi:hypothetical protein
MKKKKTYSEDILKSVVRNAFPQIVIHAVKWAVKNPEFISKTLNEIPFIKIKSDLFIPPLPPVSAGFVRP